MGYHIRNNKNNISDGGEKMKRIINWIKYHEYEHEERNDRKNESSALVDMGSRQD